MISMKQLFVIYFYVQCFQLVIPKPIFKGLSFKKNYEMEISAIPFKHISFIKEKWFPFKMNNIKHDVAKREVAEDPKEENLYSVNEVNFDNEANGNYPELYTSVKQNLDLKPDGGIVEKPVVENIQDIHIKPVIETENSATGIVHTSSVIPINPSLIIAPTIHTIGMGTAVQPAAVVPINPVVESSALKEAEVPVVEVPEVVAPEAPKEEVTPIQPMHTHIDLPPSIEKLEESVSKMHTDISSVVPLNTLVSSPVQEMDLPLPVDVKVEPPKVVEPPPVITPVAAPPTIVPIVELPVPVPGPEVEAPVKSGPAGLIMRGTRFVLYFGSVMLQLLSQMISQNPISLNQIAEPLALNNVG